MDWIGSTLEVLAALIDAATGLVVVLGMGAAFFEALRSRSAPSTGEVRLVLGRWHALALELALAADIVRSVFAPTWDDIGKLAAIAAIRTVLNYFLEKEIERGAMSLASRAA
jgi:uncharacterized membrane protein